MTVENKIISQRLEPLHDEALKIIGGLVETQGMVKQVEKDCEDNILTLKTQVV